MLNFRKFIFLTVSIILTQNCFAMSVTSNNDDIGDLLHQLFGNGDSPKGLPQNPRTVIKLEQKVSRPTKVTLGLQTSIFDVVEVNLKTEVEYDRDFAVTTWIFVEGENADIIRQHPGGSYFFDPGNRRAVRLCSISASYTLNNNYIGKVFVGATGIDKSIKYSGVEEILQSSELVEIKPGESPETHKRACDEFAKRKYAEVTKSLDALATSRIYWDDLSQCNPRETITRDSVCGRWHRTLFPSVTAWTTPVCERRSGQKNYFCNLRSIKGGACSYRDPETKQRLTSGMFEYPCAEGLFCQLIKASGWFNYAKAECRPLRNNQLSSREFTKPAGKTHE